MSSGVESRRENEDPSPDDNGLSSSYHVVGMEDSISPTDGSSAPVFGSLIDACDGVDVPNAMPKFKETRETRNPLRRRERRWVVLSEVVVVVVSIGRGGDVVAARSWQSLAGRIDDARRVGEDSGPFDIDDDVGDAPSRSGRTTIRDDDDDNDDDDGARDTIRPVDSADETLAIVVIIATANIGSNIIIPPLARQVPLVIRL
jgi:hypothetical protein